MMHVTQNSNIVGLNMKHNFPIIIPVEPIGPGAVVKLHYDNQVSKKQNVGSLREREVACLASDLQGSIFYSSVRAVSSHLSHHSQEVLLVQFSLYVHKGGLKPHSFIH